MSANSVTSGTNSFYADLGATPKPKSGPNCVSKCIANLFHKFLKNCCCCCPSQKSTKPTLQARGAAYAPLLNPVHEAMTSEEEVEPRTHTMSELHNLPTDKELAEQAKNTVELANLTVELEVLGRQLGLNTTEESEASIASAGSPSNASILLMFDEEARKMAELNLRS